MCNDYSFKRGDIIGCLLFNHLLLHVYCCMGFQDIKQAWQQIKVSLLKTVFFLLYTTRNDFTAKELTRILKLLVGKSSDHVLNTSNFVQHIKGIKVQQNECIISYQSTFYISAPSTFHQLHQRQADIRQRSPKKEHQWKSITSSACWSSA